jgi:hypothetical protein
MLTQLVRKAVEAARAAGQKITANTVDIYGGRAVGGGPDRAIETLREVAREEGGTVVEKGWQSYIK